jgi:hypothetical protein
MKKLIIPTIIGAAIYGASRVGRRDPYEDRAWMDRLALDVQQRAKEEKLDRQADKDEKLARGWKRVRVPEAEVEAQYADAMEDWSLRRAEAGPMSSLFASMDYPQPQRSDFRYVWRPPKSAGRVDAW